MKKLFAFFLAVFMIASISTPVFAEYTFSDHNESATIVVGGNFRETGAIYKTISVDIAWDAMTFEYIKTSSGDWNPGTHQYEGGVEGAWTEETRTISVTNHSDVEITATLSFEATSQVLGAFESTGEMASILELDSAVGAEVAPSASDEFGIIDGDPLEEDGSLGMITVYIEAPFGTVTEGPVITSATLSGAATLISDNTYQVVCTYENQWKTVGLTLTGNNIDMIVGQENYKVGFLATDGTMTGIKSLSEFSYNEAENTLTGETDIQFFDGSLKLVYSADAGVTWIRLPVSVKYIMDIDISGVSFPAVLYFSGMIEDRYKVIWYEDTKTYKIRHNGAKNNTELEFCVTGLGIQYLSGLVTVQLRKADGTVVEEISVSRKDYSDSALCYTLRYPNVVKDETLSIWYHYNGEWHDTGKKVVYDVYYSISDYS